MIVLEMTKAYLHANEISESSRKIEYFSHHINRCKRIEDKVKLIAMIIFLLAHVTINTVGLIESTKDIKNNILI